MCIRFIFSNIPIAREWHILTEIEEVDGVISFDFTNTTYTDVQSPMVEMDMTEGVWYNILGQLVDIQSYKGIVISKQGKVLLR